MAFTTLILMGLDSTTLTLGHTHIIIITTTILGLTDMILMEKEILMLQTQEDQLHNLTLEIQHQPEEQET
jgi:hypothetical protein